VPATQSKRRNTRLIQSIDHAEQTALEAVRKFLDTVDDAFPHLSDEKPRRRIVDSAFEMTERLVAASTGLAKNVVELTQEASEAGRKAAAPRKKAARPAKAAKATKSAKKTTAMKRSSSAQKR